MRASGLINALTVDVEDWFQVQAYAHIIRREDWDGMECRVERNTHALLDLFAEAGVKGTCFTLGWVADRYPALIRRIVADGHELASHGYWHRLAHQQTQSDFLDDISQARKTLENIGGVPVRGYRAPTFSINARTPWAFDALAEAGYTYSSSIYPIRHDLYGTPDAPRAPHRVGSGRLLEIPMSTVRLAGRNIPCAGGGYFRLLPYAVFQALLRRLNHGEHMSGVFYTHPWEIDPGQPVVAAPLLSRFRHRVNLGRTEARLKRLLAQFAWDRMDRVFDV
jgi:polysaccharide deacetylase family protein (PEP-CTERM system associated)